MDRKHLNHYMKVIQDRNNSKLGPQKSTTSKETVMRRIKHQMQRELREYEESWNF